MGFFSFLNELVFAGLVEKGLTSLKLGHTTMRTSFSQIYDKTAEKAESMLNSDGKDFVDYCKMPLIKSATDLLDDIKSGEQKTELMKWVIRNAEL